MNQDVLFSDDVEQLRLEIVRLRSLLDSEYRVTECYHNQCESLSSIVQSFISNQYGK